jgi:phage gp36-like protein
MSWETPTADDVLSEFTPTELATITTLMGGAPLNNTGKLSTIVTRTIAEIRGYIRSGDFDLDPDASKIPLELFTAAIAIARWRLLISAPQLKQLQTDDRKDAYKEAIKKLEQIAEGILEVEPIGEPGTHTGKWNTEQKIVMRTHNAYANASAPEDTLP